MVIDNELLTILKIFVTGDEVTRLRRLIAESGQTPYSDDILKESIALHPLVDRNDNKPFSSYVSSIYISSVWVPTWDLYAVAADVWTEKAANVSCKTDFRADGVSVNRSDLHENYLKQARICMSKRVGSAVMLVAQDRGNKRDDYVVVNASDY